MINCSTRSGNLLPPAAPGTLPNSTPYTLVHAHAQVKQLLDSRLPEVWAGTPVVKADIPWPRALDIREDNLIPGTDIYVVSA